ncbi:hypothetical protein [Halovivax cerinus]|uniref:Uncharacterized protein n=1 Tax=Halovivax cerinus TaxID=1487865 RepID=A0ABD5NRM4_9EURY|nr:hypothetical protein [Halovivax cerinus]
MSAVVTTIHAACRRFGPGRLPGADKPSLGGGYAAASAAVVAASLYAAAASSTGVGLLGANEAAVEFAAFALPFVVPAAFLVGVAGWRLTSPTSPAAGLLAGLVGTVATYIVAAAIFGAVAVALWARSWDGLLEGATFASLLAYVGFLETWWATLPVGGLSGVVYASVVRRGR